MNILHALIIGIVEGFTEFLPISSTAHMDIVRTLLGIPATDFVKSFEIIIQLGAILAVVLLYFKKIFSSWKYFRNIVIAFIPTAIIGFALYKVIKSLFLGNLALEATMLLLGGIVIVLYEKKSAKRDMPSGNVKKAIESLTVKELLLLGIAQALAVVPGVSRSGAVIIAGRMQGLSRVLITEFSFLLAIPTMLAATGYELLKSGFSFTGPEWGTLAVGFIITFITALIAAKWLLRYIRSHSFIIFGWYRIVLGGILLLVLVL